MTLPPSPSVDLPANDVADVAELRAELERLRGALTRIRGVAFVMAGSPARLDPLKPLAPGREGYATIVRTCDAALEVRAADVVTPLFGRAAS